jgi:chorismate mutase
MSNLNETTAAVVAVTVESINKKIGSLISNADKKIGSLPMAEVMESILNCNKMQLTNIKGIILVQTSDTDLVAFLASYRQSQVYTTCNIIDIQNNNQNVKMAYDKIMKLIKFQIKSLEAKTIEVEF